MQHSPINQREVGRSSVVNADDEPSESRLYRGTQQGDGDGEWPE